MLLFGICLGVFIAAGALYMEWDHKHNWVDDRKDPYEARAIRGSQKLVRNNPHLASLMLEANLL
jgi:hypothetical protein